MHSHRYLLIVAQEQFSCVIPELESIAASFDIDLSGKFSPNVEVLPSDGKKFPAVQILQPVSENDIRILMSRSVLIKDALELWATGQSIDELKISISNYIPFVNRECFDSSTTFAIRVKGLGKKISLSQQVEKIEALEGILPLEGKVDLVNPDEEFSLIEDYSYVTNESNPKQPSHVYFGRFICSGQRDLIRRYSLKKRKFIGNTSMDPMLGLVMANLACARPSTYVCDPFVGTGSLLISAAHFGAYVTGGDISYKILHAQGKSSRRGAGKREKDETIKDSLINYGMGRYYVDALVCDAANHAWRIGNKELFDAIITDPPYGIREACQRLGSKKEGEVSVPDLPPGHVHYPEQKAYHLDDVFKDLLSFAARSLIKGGRLVYWLPVHRNDYTPDVIPSHPSLKLLYNCEQVLNSHSSRRLIVMEKNASRNVTHDINSQASIKSEIYIGHNAFRDKYFKAQTGSGGQ